MRLYSSGMLFVLVAILCVAGCSRCNRCQGADPDPATRVRVALALSATSQQVSDSHGCGVCLPESTARAKARKAGVPLVLFVGGCSGRAASVIAGTTAVAGRTATYRGDSVVSPGDPGRSRIVVLSPGVGDVWHVQSVLSDQATPDQVRGVLPAKPMPVSTRLDWQVAAPRYAPLVETCST